MKTQSAKAKGRRLQQWFRDLLIDKLGIHKEDIESRSMGAGGEDLIMSRSARNKFPYSIECKNQEKYLGILQTSRRKLKELRTCGSDEKKQS